MGKKLRPKQKLFVEFYLQSWNATQAAQKAGYKGSYGTLKSVGCENLTKPDIQKEISKRIGKTVMESDEVLSRLAAMGRGFDVTEYIQLREVYSINKEGKELLSGLVVWMDFDKLQADGFSGLIKKVKSTRAGIEIEWHDQMAALVHIGKHHALFTDKVELEGTLEFRQILENIPDEELDELIDEFQEAANRPHNASE